MIAAFPATLPEKNRPGRHFSRIPWSRSPYQLISKVCMTGKKHGLQAKSPQSLPRLHPLIFSKIEPPIGLVWFSKVSHSLILLFRSQTVLKSLLEKSARITLPSDSLEKTSLPSCTFPLNVIRIHNPNKSFAPNFSDVVFNQPFLSSSERIKFQ